MSILPGLSLFRQAALQPGATLFATLLLATTAFSCSQGNPGNSNRETAEKVEQASDKSDPRKVILFFGNSLTAGYGLETGQDFPAIIQDKIDSLQLPYRVVNAGVSGETTSGGKGRIDWVLEQDIDIFVLELGANDGLRGIDPVQSKANLQAIIDAVRTAKPEARIILTGMQVPPNMGQDYSNDFRDIFPALAAENNLTLLPFLLENVGGQANLNQADGIHPNAEGAKIMAENVWDVLEPNLVE